MIENFTARNRRSRPLGGEEFAIIQVAQNNHRESAASLAARFVRRHFVRRSRDRVQG
jgi:GGDEF domain-containing protein